MKGKDEKKVKDFESEGSTSVNPELTTHSEPPQPRRGPTLIRPEDMQQYMKNPSLGFFSVAKDDPGFNSDSFSSESDSDLFLSSQAPQ